MNQPSDKLPLNVKLAHRSGFTIVELLVAMALIVFMMSIMSQAFVIATTAMSGLKKVTDLVDKVRPAMAILERDLGAYHFDGSRRLSDVNFWESGPPTAGYFSVWQDKPNSNHYPFGATTASEFNNASANPTYGEGIKDGVAFAMANADANHMLAFTVKANPVPNSTSISPDDYFGLNIPYAGIGTDIQLNNKITGTLTQSNLGNDLANIYFPPGGGSAFDVTGNKLLNFRNQSLSNNGPGNALRLEKLLTDWMEVAYFIRDSGRKTDNGVPICTLYRQHRMLLPKALPEPDRNIPYTNLLNLVNSRTLYLNDDPGSTLTNPLQALYNISCFTNNDSTRLPLSTNTSGTFWYADSKWPLKFNTPETLTVPWRRLGNRAYNHAGVVDATGGQDFFKPYNVQNPNHPGAYSDVFLNNVLSFEVKLMIDNSMNFKSLWETAGIDARDISNSAIVNAPDRYPGPDFVYPYSPLPSGHPDYPNTTYQKYNSPIPAYPAFANITDLLRNYGFTRIQTTALTSDPFWKRSATFDRVVFDTWSRHSDSPTSVDDWETEVLPRVGAPSMLEMNVNRPVYPKPKGGNTTYGSRTFADGNPIYYDYGAFIDPLIQDANVVLDGAAYPPIDDDRDPLTPNISIPEKGQLNHPFYGPITTATRLKELLASHQNYKWMPTPGPGVDRIPIWQNSFVDGIKVTGAIPSKQRIYFPKGPRIYAIQISIRIYDENTKTTKEFKLIQRL